MSFTEPENGIKDRKKNHHDLISIKVTIIIILIALLMIPGSFIEDMVNERETTKNQAFNETAKKWGRSQSVNGPILYVPVEYEKTIEKTVRVNNPKEGESGYEIVEEIETYTKELRILPEELHINGEIIPEIRYKSIYEILLYRSDINISGNFLLTEDDKYPATGKILWEEAFIAVGFSSMKSIKEVVDLSFGKENIKLEQGLCKKDIYDYGLSSQVKIDHEAGKIIPFSYNLKLDGSCELLFTPLGKETSVELRSEWADPNFTGNFLPNERDISDSGFVAKWNVMHLNREYPQNWEGEGLKNKIKGSRFGVKLIIPVDDYRKISRSVKYLLLFVSLTFLMFFLSESIAKKKIHPVQYILVGLSIVIFFVLLLSLSEHVAFITSYVIAALSTISMISLYAMSIIKSKKFTGFIALALSMLYIFLYILLENQDYSLLFGSLGLFLALSITMYATRNIDWYNIKYEKDVLTGENDEKDQTNQL
ncbi:MAG: cell envelope integrity protein CreD [Candidatus Delongbacteria bacterium]|nr:cell envelope integrity protein CreD [Candidatus Delongbacteria bacterium]